MANRKGIVDMRLVLCICMTVPGAATGGVAVAVL